MKMNEFDRIIREKMENLNPEYAPETWELLEQKMDASEAGPAVVTDEEAIDELAFSKLHQYETPYNPEDWKTFARRLEEEAASTREVLRYKLVEVSLMLLLLLTLWQYLPVGQNQPLPSVQPELPTKPMQSPVPKAHLENTPAPDGQGPLSENGARLSANLDTDQKGTATPNALAFTNKARSFDGGEEANWSENTTGLATPANRTNSYKPSFIPGITQNNLHITKQDRLDYLMGNPSSRKVLPAEWNTEALLASLESIELEALSPSSTAESLELLPLTPRKKFNIRIGMQGSPNYDRIITPPTEVDEDSIVSLDRYSIGYTGGITLGVERGRWEVETGFFYAAKSYQPLSVLYVTGSVKNGLYGEGAKDFEFNTVYLPLNIRYNYLQKDTWRLFASAGVSMHTVVQANYYLADQDGFRNALFAPAPVPRGEQERPEQVEQYDLNKGLFEGGGLWENSYFSATVGLGVEKNLNGRLSVFSQAKYAHSFLYPTGGIGPFLDRFHTTSLLMGIRVVVSN
mgnify:CR=1 FL=1